VIVMTKLDCCWF